MASINCYKEGYNNGLADAENRRSKRYTGFPKAKALISSNCYDTYVQGYDKGYADGMAKRNNVFR